MANVNERLSRLTSLRARLSEGAFNVLKTDPWVPITLSGQQFKLEYSFYAVKTMYQEAGMKLTDNTFDITLLSDPELLAKALYYGLITHQPEVTQDGIDRLIHMKHRVYYAHCIQTAIEATQPDIKDLEDYSKDDSDPLAGTGISLASGPSVTN